MKQGGVASLRHSMKELGQYREPLCYELSGLSFHLKMDTGENFAVAFLSGSTVEYRGQNGTVKQGVYECLKLKRKLYLVRAQTVKGKPLAGLALDLESGFSAVLMESGRTLSTGAIVASGLSGEPGNARGSQSLAGHTVLWRCGARDLFAQYFVDAEALRILYANPSGEVCTLQYTASYIFLREDIALIEAHAFNQGESILMLADINAVRAVGYSCLSVNNAVSEPRCVLFSAYGAFIPSEERAQAVLAGDNLQKYKKRMLGKPIYNPITRQPIAGGLKQYVYPCTEELTGKTLDLRIDGQAPAMIRFADASTLEWAFSGKPYCTERYECVKGEDAVYLIVCHPANRQPASCVTLIWDTETRLVTAVLAWDTLDAACPRLVTSRAFFGAENREGEPMPTLRHHFTEDLLGRRFVWHYTANDDVLHICFDKTHFRLGRASLELAPNPSADALAHYERLMRRKAKYPDYEEVVYYIKIKEGLYLYSVIEYAMCRLLANQGGGELLALVNTARERYIGRSFGLDAQENAGHDIIGAPGCELNLPDEVERLPCPMYNV